MSFQQGLSGLNAQAKNLDVIGNNIANVSTVGFKSSRAEFADVYANSLYGTGALQTGIGTQVADVSQQFSQGNISTTSNPLDIAINGNGFFILDDGGSDVYSRNGQFQLDKEGYIVNNTGQRLSGIQPDGSPGPIQISLDNSLPKATDRAAMSLNLDIGTETIPAATTPFDPSDPTTFSFSTAFTVFDAPGNPHTQTVYFRKVDTAPTPPASVVWEVYFQLDGNTTAPDFGMAAGTNASNTLQFGPDGQLAAPNPGQFTLTTGVLANTNPVTYVLDLTGTTQFGANFGVYSIEQNGYTTGQLAGLTVGEDGTINGRYTNGQTNELGQIALISFRNPQGLVAIGNNLWVDSSDAGKNSIGAPGSPGLGTLRSGAVEESNVDLTAELVNLIVAQRLYQANAQTIRAQDQILQTLVTLR